MCPNVNLNEHLHKQKKQNYVLNSKYSLRYKNIISMCYNYLI